MFSVVEFIRIPVRNSDLPNRRPQSGWSPSDRAKTQLLTCSHGDVRLFKGSGRAGTKSPKVIGTWHHVRDSESSARRGMNPELVGQILLLKVDPVIDRRKSDQHAHGRGARIKSVVDRKGSAYSSAGVGLRIGRIGHAGNRLGFEPGIRPRRLFRLSLGLRVGPKDLSFQGNRIA